MVGDALEASSSVFIPSSGVSGTTDSILISGVITGVCNLLSTFGILPAVAGMSAMASSMATSPISFSEANRVDASSPVFPIFSSCL